MTFLDESTLHREFTTFFRLAERTRRWNVFEDIPWGPWRPEWASAERALCAETFCGVEMYLPDYVAEGLRVVRPSFGQTWFHVNWGYEESKHALALREYLVRTGQRSAAELARYEQDVLARTWVLPFSTAREMAVYGALQEKATWMIYRTHLRLAQAAGDEVLTAIYRHVSRDEAAHAGFSERLLALSMEQEPEGTVADFSQVVRAFHMPAFDLLPGYDDRVQLMRLAGIERGTFLREVLFPVMRRLRIDRRDLARATVPR